MSAPIFFMPFLRPLGQPRPQTVKQFIRFFTRTPRQRDERAAKTHVEDPNIIASRDASPTYPPKSMKTLSRPKESRASHRTAHPRPERQYPTRHPTHHPVSRRKIIPEPIEPLSADQCVPNLPYYVTRTRSRELPVYTEKKRGGNLILTKVKSIDGKKEALRDALRNDLGLDEKEAKINPITGHLVLKGNHKTSVVNYLRARLM